MTSTSNSEASTTNHTIIDKFEERMKNTKCTNNKVERQIIKIDT